MGCRVSHRQARNSHMKPVQALYLINATSLNLTGNLMDLAARHGQKLLYYINPRINAFAEMDAIGPEVEDIASEFGLASSFPQLLYIMRDCFGNIQIRCLFCRKGISAHIFGLWIVILRIPSQCANG